MDLKRQQQLCLDGIRTSLAIADIASSRLHDLLLTYSEAHGRGERTARLDDAVLLAAWSLVDVANRLRLVVDRTPGLKKNAGVKSFLKAMGGVEALRHYVQHLDTELATLAESGWPIWGSLTWTHKPTETHDTNEVTVIVLIPGSFARSDGYPVVNPAGKTLRMPIDHISLTAAGTTVNLSEVAHACGVFGRRLEAAVETAEETEIEQSSGEVSRILRIALDLDRKNPISA